jgi:hypothetical protein
MSARSLVAGRQRHQPEFEAFSIDEGVREFGITSKFGRKNAER